MNLLNTLCFLPDGTLDRRDVEIEGGALRLHSPGTLKEGTDASRMLCLPGMVNAHFHGLSTPGKGLEHDHPLTEWFGEVPETAMQARVYDVIEQDLLEEEMEAIALFEYMQLLKQGVTRVFDGGAVNGSIPAQKRALERLGMRGVLDADSLLPDFAGQDSSLVSFAGHLLEEEDLTEEALSAVKSLYDRFPERIFGSHCLETAYRRQLAEDFCGKSSPELFWEKGLLSHRNVLYHCVHADERDWDIIAKSGAGVVHNPVSNLYTGTGIMNLPAVLKRGIPCGLGTDWGSTDWWEVLRTAYHLMKVQPGGEAYRAQEILQLACQGGCRVLGDSEGGRLRDGAAADLVLLSLDTPALYPDFPGHPALLHNLVTQGSGDGVKGVCIAGNWVVWDGVCTQVDEKAAAGHWRDVMEKIREKAGAC